MSTLLNDILERARPTTLAALIVDLEASEDAISYIDELRSALFESIGHPEGEMMIEVERREV